MNKRCSALQQAKGEREGGGGMQDGDHMGILRWIGGRVLTLAQEVLMWGRNGTAAMVSSVMCRLS